MTESEMMDFIAKQNVKIKEAIHCIMRDDDKQAWNILDDTIELGIKEMKKLYEKINNKE
jgi:hypothetical protein